MSVETSIVCARCHAPRGAGSASCTSTADVIQQVVAADTYAVGVTEGTGLTVGPKTKSGPGSKPRWQRELKRTVEGYHQTDRRVERTLDINRFEQVISERLVDTVTGETVEEKSEPLSKHAGHGDAKPGRRKQKGRAPRG